MPTKYFVNPKTGRRCKVGGATHKKLIGGKFWGRATKRPGMPIRRRRKSDVYQRGKGPISPLITLGAPALMALLGSSAIGLAARRNKKKRK